MNLEYFVHASHLVHAYCWFQLPLNKRPVQFVPHSLIMHIFVQFMHLPVIMLELDHAYSFQPFTYGLSIKSIAAQPLVTIRKYVVQQ